MGRQGRRKGQLEQSSKGGRSERITRQRQHAGAALRSEVTGVGVTGGGGGVSQTVVGRERRGKSTRLFVDPGKRTSRKEAPAMQREAGGAGVAKPDKGREQGGEDSEDSKKHPDVDTLGIQPQITAPLYCPPRCMECSSLP